MNIKTKKIVKTFAVLLFAFILLLLCAFAPKILFTRLDRQSFAGVLPVLRTSSPLAAEAEDIYLVRALHQRQTILREKTASTENRENIRFTPEEFFADFKALQAAGTIPESALFALDSLLKNSTASITQTRDGTGFIKTTLEVTTPSPFKLIYEKEELTGIITRCWRIGKVAGYTENESSAPLAAVQSYIEYTTTGDITDWTKHNGAYAAGLHSQKCQILAFYNDAFNFGLATLF